jgi:uncharacterized protein
MLKFLCDQMLANLAPWLRAAGYDTLIVHPKMSDREILQQAVKEGRYLLTRDRHFLEMDDPNKKIVFLPGETLEELATHLKSITHLNWLARPFSRCLLCNEELTFPDPEIVKRQVPDQILAQERRFWYCKHCNKVYWEGSHTKRMFAQLQAWQHFNKKV